MATWRGAEEGGSRMVDGEGPMTVARGERNMTERRRSLPVSYRIAVVATGQAARRHGEGGIGITDPGEPTA